LLESPANCSSSLEHYIRLLRLYLSVFNPVGDYAQRQCFDGSESLITRLAIGEYSGKIGNLTDPATVSLSL